jgi:hypothetical protein
MWSSTAKGLGLGLGAGAAGSGVGASGILGDVSDALSAPRRYLWEALGLPSSGHELLEKYAGMDPGLGSNLLGSLAEMAGDPLTYLPGALGAAGGLMKDWRYAGNLAKIAAPVAEDAEAASQLAGRMGQAHDAETMARVMEHGTANPSLTVTSPGPALTRIGDPFSGEIPLGGGATDWMKETAPLAMGAEEPGLRETMAAAADPRNANLRYAPEIDQALPDMMTKRDRVSSKWLKALQQRPVGATGSFGNEAGTSAGKYLADIGLGGTDPVSGKPVLMGAGRPSDVPGLFVRGGRAGPDQLGGLLDNPLVYQEQTRLPFPTAGEAMGGEVPANLAGLPLDQALPAAQAAERQAMERAGQLNSTMAQQPALLRALLRIRGANF